MPCHGDKWAPSLGSGLPLLSALLSVRLCLPCPPSPSSGPLAIACSRGTFFSPQSVATRLLPLGDSTIKEMLFSAMKRREQ